MVPIQVPSAPWLVLALTGVALLCFGAACALWPSRMAAMTELSLPTPTARTDFAATYGGFQIGFAVFLLACTRSPGWMEPGLWAGASASAGFAGMRTVGIVLSRGRVNAVTWLALGMELAGLVLNAWALGQLR